MGLKYYNDLIWGLQAKLAKWFNFLEKNPSLKRRIPPHWTTCLIFGWFGVPPFEEVPPYQYCNLQQRTCIQNWTRKRPQMDLHGFFSLLEWSGWWLTYPSEKYWKAVGMMTFPIYTKNKKCSKPPTSYCASGIFLDFCIGFQATTCSASGIWDQKLIWLCLKIGHSPIERLIIISHQNCYFAYLGGILSDFQTYPLSLVKISAYTPKVSFSFDKDHAEVRIAMTERKQSDYNSPSSGEAKTLI